MQHERELPAGTTQAPRMIRIPWAPASIVGGSQAYRLHVLLRRAPRRALLVALLLLPPLVPALRIAAGRGLADVWIVVAAGGALLLICVLALLEAAHAADFLTTTGLVRVSGFLGRKRTVLSYGSMEWVDWKPAGSETSSDFGDVELQTPGRVTILAGVQDPAGIVQNIRAAMAEAAAARSGGSRGAPGR